MPNDTIPVQPQALNKGVNVRGGLAYLVLPKTLPATMLLELHDVANCLAMPLDEIARPDPIILESTVGFVLDARVPFQGATWRRASMEETRIGLLRVAAESLRQAHAIAVLLDAKAAAAVGTTIEAAGGTLPCDVEPAIDGAQP
jgi:hypothetical protein